ncbi:MAG TPA: lipoyl synthase, partial [Thermoanaerobaculia bacterium]|nr:lipoyl synthase [Thermoanaerobaculia bacterium]
MSETLVQLGRASGSEVTDRPRREPRPEWLRIKLATPAQYYKVRGLVESLNLHTVCQEAKCPNIYECWGEHGTATFMILGDICTRACGFCAIKTGRPLGLDREEPERVAEAISQLDLRFAVITSVNR